MCVCIYNPFSLLLDLLFRLQDIGLFACTSLCLIEMVMIMTMTDYDDDAG